MTVSNIKVYEQSRGTAIRLAKHYLKQSFRGSYTSDQDAEMEVFVDAIINAAIARTVDIVEDMLKLALEAKEQEAGAEPEFPKANTTYDTSESNTSKSKK